MVRQSHNTKLNKKELTRQTDDGDDDYENDEFDNDHDIVRRSSQPK